MSHLTGLGGALVGNSGSLVQGFNAAFVGGLDCSDNI